MPSSGHAHRSFNKITGKWVSVMACHQRVSDVCYREFGELSCTECIGQGNDFELIPTVKMETSHPIEESFGNEFPSICNHREVVAA